MKVGVTVLTLVLVARRWLNYEQGHRRPFSYTLFTHLQSWGWAYLVLRGPRRTSSNILQPLFRTRQPYGQESRTI